MPKSLSSPHYFYRQNRKWHKFNQKSSQVRIICIKFAHKFKDMNRKDFEIMAPVGSYESLYAAIHGGADAIYFGIEGLNMRARSANNFTTDDLRKIAGICDENGLKSYLTVNTIVYDEDIALMRMIPGMVVINPCDDVEAKAAVKAAYEHVGPVYLRFGRLAVPVINDNADYKFEIGKAITLREGTDVTIIATGLEVSESLAAAEKLAADGIDAKVINIHTIKPLDEDLVVAAAKETGKVVTVEEHSIIGGLGGAVCECLAEKAPVPVKRIGIHDVFGESGPALELLHKYGLDAEGIYKQIKEFA